MKQLLLLPKTNGPSPPAAKIEVATLFSAVGIACLQAVVRPRFPSNFAGGAPRCGLLRAWLQTVAASPHRMLSEIRNLYGLDTPYPTHRNSVIVPATLRKSPTNYENSLSPFRSRHFESHVIRSPHLGS